MDEISRDPLPEPSNEDPTLFTSESRHLAPLPECVPGDAALDAPPPQPETRFTFAAEPAEAGFMTEPEQPAPDEDPHVPAPAGGEPDEQEPTGPREPVEAELGDVPALEDNAQLARVVVGALLASREPLSFLRLAQICNVTQKRIEEAV